MPLQIRRAANATERLGTTAQPFMPLVGEQILQLDNDIMYMGDGTTRGGVATTFAPYSAAGTYAQGDVVLVAAGDSTTIYRYVSPHLKSAGAFNASEVDTDNNAIWSSVAGGGGGGLTVRHLGLTAMNVLADELITDNERLWLMMENQTNRSLTAPPTDNTSLLLSGGDVLPILSDPTTAGDYVRRVGTAPVAYPTDDIPTTFSPTVGATRSPTIHRENATTFAIQFNQTAANQPSAANLLTYFPMGSTFYIPAANLRDFQGQTLSPAPYAIRGTVNGTPTVVPGGEGYVVRVPVTGVNDEFLADNTSHTFYFNAIQVLPQQSWVASDGHDGSFTTDVSITKTVPKLTFNETNTDATTTADIELQANGTNVGRIVGGTNGTAGSLDFQMANQSGTLTPMMTLMGFQDTIEMRRPTTFAATSPITAQGTLSVAGATTLSGGANITNLAATGTLALPGNSITSTMMANNAVSARNFATVGDADGTVGQVLSLGSAGGELLWIDDAQGDENIIYRTHVSASSSLPSTQTQENYASNIAAAAVIQTFQSNGAHGNLTVDGFNRWIRTGDTTSTTSFEESVNLGVSSFAIQGPTSGTYTLQPVIQDSTDGVDFPSALTGAAIHTGPVFGATYGVDTTHQFGTFTYNTTTGRPYRRLVWRLASLEEAVNKTFYGPHAPLLVTDTDNAYSNTDLVLQADPELHHDYLWRNTAANQFTAVEAKTPAVLSVDTQSSTLTLDNAGRLSAEVAPIGDADGTLTDLTGPAVVALTHYNYSFNVSTNLSTQSGTGLTAGGVRYANNNNTTVGGASTLGTGNAITPSADANNPTEVDIQTFETASGTNAARTYAIAVWGGTGNLPSGLLTTNQEINGGARDLTLAGATGFQRLVLHWEDDDNWFVGRLVSFAVGPASGTGQINSFRYHIVAGRGTVPDAGTAIHVGGSTAGATANVTQLNSITGLTYAPGSQLVPAPLFSGNIHGGGQTLQGLGVSAAPQNITDDNLVDNAKLGENNSFTGTNSFDSTTSFNAASTFSLPVTAASAPTANTHLTNKAYVDGLVTGLPDAPTAPTAPAVEVAPTGEWRLRYRAPGLMYAPTTTLGGASIAPTYSGVAGGQIASIGDWQLQEDPFRTNSGLSGGTLTVGTTYVLRVHRGTNPGNGIVTHLGGLPTFNSPAAPGAYLNESNYGYLVFIGAVANHFVFKINRRGFDNFDDSNVYYEMVLQFAAGNWLTNGSTNNMLFSTTATGIPGITNFTAAAAFDWVLVS